MNKLTFGLSSIIVALSFCLGTAINSRAQDKSFSGVIPFVTSNDRVGFLDQNNGKVYVYDNNLGSCVFTGQIQTLGAPIQVISSPAVNTVNP